MMNIVQSTLITIASTIVHSAPRFFVSRKIGPGSAFVFIQKSHTMLAIVYILLLDVQVADYHAPYRPDNKAYMPDFTIEWQDQTYYWEHLGMLNKPAYQRKWEEKKAWDAEHFPGQLLTTQETSTLSEETKMTIASRFGVEPIDVDIETEL